MYADDIPLPPTHPLSRSEINTHQGSQLGNSTRLPFGSSAQRAAPPTPLRISVSQRRVPPSLYILPPIHPPPPIYSSFATLPQYSETYIEPPPLVIPVAQPGEVPSTFRGRLQDALRGRIQEIIARWRNAAFPEQPTDGLRHGRFEMLKATAMGRWFTMSAALLIAVCLVVLVLRRFQAKKDS
ncbi:unnamed protein product [Cyclocybe aegerita]|uniref:Uncharacterized protein n=1 Tax=Cyclocybe aegerita TaxID=1973307 RepID=A0A8S0XPP8_CYCAE|nr:unnamed protein product [Cyclocybe aegerita]